jgi:cyanophycinase
MCFSRLSRHGWRPFLACGLLALSGALCQAQTLIAIGGALRQDNSEVWQRIVQEAGGPGARIAVLATASTQPVWAAEQAMQALARAGAQVHHIEVAPHLPGRDWRHSLEDPQWQAWIAQARGVFFTGGTQALIMETLAPQGRPSALLQAIRALYERGGVIAGTSAGAAVMSAQMIRDIPQLLHALREPLRQGQALGQGLGLLAPGVLVDQHFLRRGRIGRLLPAMLATGAHLGLGVEEDSAAVIRAGQLEVIGRRGVLLADLGQASGQLAPLRLQGARLSYLERGDRHDLTLGLSQPAPGRRPQAPAASGEGSAALAGQDLTQHFADNILGEHRLVAAMSMLFEAATPELLAQAWGEDAGQRFEFRFYRDAQSQAWRDDQGISLLRLGLDIQPLPSVPR